MQESSRGTRLSVSSSVVCNLSTRSITFLSSVRLHGRSQTTVVLISFIPFFLPGGGCEASIPQGSDAVNRTTVLRLNEQERARLSNRGQDAHYQATVSNTSPNLAPVEMKDSVRCFGANERHKPVCRSPRARDAITPRWLSGRCEPVSAKSNGGREHI